jgi:hypothetical protein
MSTSTKVLVIDDHAVVRAGISAALEKRSDFIVFQAASKAEAFAQLAKHNPDAIVVDINLPDGSGLEVVSWARSISQTLAIIVLTMSESSEFTLAAMRAGASAYLNKSLPLGEVISAIEYALVSPLVFSSRDTVKIFDRDQLTLGLSQREIQILSQLHLGAPLKDLAASLFIAEATLKTHLASIYRKLEVKNRVQAIDKARIAGLT